MYATQVFYYIQRQIVVISVAGITSPKLALSYMPVYAKTLTLHRGVDNQIQFQFLNQNQKPIDITGKSITCRLISYRGNELLLEKSLTIQLALTGIAALMLTPEDLANINPQKCYYSLEIPVGTFNYPVFVHSDAGARGDMDIVDSVLPSFVESTSISIPTGQIFPNTEPGLSLCSTLSGTTLTYYSSVIDSDKCPSLTLQVAYDNYSGNIVVEGSTISDGDWYDASNAYSYANNTGTEGYVVNGYHPYVRLKFISSGGSVNSILSR